MIGLPNSGTTALLLRLLERSAAKDDSKGLDIYETVLFKDSVSGQYKLQDISDDDSKNDLMILLSLSKFLVTKHYRVNLSPDQLSGVFSHSEVVNTYFGELCTKLFQMMRDIDMPAAAAAELPNNFNSRRLHSRKVMLTRSHSFINFFDINVNKAVYEAVFILGSEYSSVVLFNVLNLYYYTKEKLAESLDLSDPDYNGKYSENEHHLFSLHKALEYHVLAIEATFVKKRESHNTILVGTHADKFDSQLNIEVRAGEVYKLIGEYAQSIDINGALAILSAGSSNIIPIKYEDSADCRKVMEEFLRVVDRDKQFEEYVPMKFMFLRCMLHSTNKLFITFEEFKGYASACYICENEIGDFLKLFRKCCSLFPIQLRGEDQYSYVILKPDKLIDGLNELYSKSAYDEKLKKGLLLVEKAKEIWQDGGYHDHESIRLYDFYTSVLLSVGLMVEVDETRFFLPSLRLKYDPDKPSPQSNSLIVEFSIRMIPFHKQCEFVSHFKKYYCSISFDSDCSWYNVMSFECKKNGEIFNFDIRFRSEYLEIIIKPSRTSPPAEIYSCLKRACADVLTKISKEYSDLRYKFGVVCPRSKTGDEPHFVTFSILTTSPSECDKCDTCKAFTLSSSHPAIAWIKSVFIGGYNAGVLVDGKYIRSPLCNDHAYTILAPCHAHTVTHAVVIVLSAVAFPILNCLVLFHVVFLVLFL